MTAGDAAKLPTDGVCPTLTVNVAVVGKGGEPGVQAIVRLATIVG